MAKILNQIGSEDSNKLVFVGLRQQFTPRTERHEGRDHIVAPVVMLVEGVHAGSRGPALYRNAIIGLNAIAWNGVPVTVQHPTDQYGYISANSPHVIDRQAIGKMFNVAWTGTQLKGEAWIDIAKAEAVAGGRSILDVVRNGGEAQLEVSSGLFDERIDSAGTFNGEQYSQTVERIYPDHLALLPGNVGACSWADGCGLRANKCKAIVEDKDLKKISVLESDQEPEVMTIEQLAESTAGQITESKADPTALKALAKGFARQFGFDVNELGYEEISGKLSTIVDGWDRTEGPGPRVIHYLKRTFADTFVFKKMKRGEESKLFRMPYSVVNDQVVIPDNVEPIEVAIKEEIVPVNAQMNANDTTETADPAVACAQNARRIYETKDCQCVKH